MELAKATIGELDEQDREQDPFPVQFNPTTLRLALTNRVEGDDSQGKQVRQFIGPSSTTLTVDLIFDTADEGTTENPQSVRERTKRLERFLVAKRTGQQKQVPPRMQFTWGDLIVIGVIEGLSIDFDHFAPNGVPLRAKVALSIKGQDREKQLEPREDSRRDAPAPGGGGSAGLGLGASLGASLSAGFGLSAGLGFSASFGASASIGLALGGESAADFAVRMGVDASAWRSLALGGESSLSFSAGAEIAFSASATASLGLGFTAGVTAGTSTSFEASLGLTAGGVVRQN